MFKRNKNKTLSAFSIIEVLVAILVFTLWLSGIYLVIVSTLKINDYNKNYIIASNLAREQIDLLRNLRDSNYESVYKWNHIPNNPETFTKVFTWWYYTVENDFTTSAFYPIKISPILTFWEWESELNLKMQNYKLCLDLNNNYTYDCSWTNKETKFFKYLEIDKLEYSSWWVDIIIEDAFKITSKVIWSIRWYNEVEINTVIADWKRL